MIYWFILINSMITLFGVTAISWSEKIHVKKKIILSIFYILLVIISTFLSIIQTKRESVQEKIRHSLLTNQLDSVSTQIDEKATEQLAIIEESNRPQVRLEVNKVSYNPKTQSLIFPVRNYGRIIATKITLNFDCDQLLNHTRIRIEDLPPGDPGNSFVFGLFLPVPKDSEIDNRYKLFVEDFKTGRKALVFTVSGHYFWDEKRYIIPERYGIWDKNRGIYISLSEESRMNSE